MRRVALLPLVVACGLAACATGEQVVVRDFVDAPDDVRLTHPTHPDLRTQDFDLTRLRIARVGSTIRVEATFATPVRELRGVRLSDDRVADILPQTIDVYLDTRAGEGRIKALEGRHFEVPAGEAWERVLVISSIRDLTDDAIVYPLHVVHGGRTITAVFRASDVLRSDSDIIMGVTAAVLATATRGEGRVRAVSTVHGNCQVWEDARCTLLGSGPAVLDATSPVATGRPVALDYGELPRPAPPTVPVVFARGALLSVAPVSDTLKDGRLATVVDADGLPIATAVVVSVVGDTASLKVLGASDDAAPTDITGAKGVVFAAPAAP